MGNESEKKAVGYAAAEEIESGQTVGIGTGTTVHFFIECLGQRVQQGLEIKTISSSTDSLTKAKKLGIPIIDEGQISELDITVDGADEIDPSGQMIKGGGGALLREKLLASSSKKMIVIVDSTKRVSQLGKRKLPLEIIPYFHQSTIKKINALGFYGEIRTQDQQRVITDNANWIYDLHLEKPIENAQALHNQIIPLPGVVETGLFFNLASKLIYFENNQVHHLSF